MKLSLLIVLALAGTLLPTNTVLAEDSLKAELNEEINALLPKVKLRKRSKRARSAGIILANTQATDTASSAGNLNSNTNTNLNNAESTSSAAAGASTNVSVQVTETPAQTVEATPLSESKLDRLKKNRLEMERSTEEKIVEKLESDRIAREQKRSKKTEDLTFEDEVKKVEVESDKNVEITQIQTKDTTTITPIQAQDSVVVVPAAKSEPAPVKIESSIEEDFTRIEKKEEGHTRWFIGGNGGYADYAAQNVKGVYAAGFILGIELPERLIVEGGMLFSSYDVIAAPSGMFGDFNARQIQMEQRNYTLGVKYQLSKTRIRPIVGALVSYTTRTFQDPFFSRPGSTGFDVAGVVGADINISDSFSLGADLRYFMNISSRRDQPNVNPSGYGYAYGYAAYPGVQNGSYVDEINYYVISINGTFRF
jgi:hypothetical protein